MSRPTLAIGNITGGTWRVEFAMSLLDCKDAGVFDALLINPGQLYLDVSRNKVVEEFWRNRTQEYLLFVDSDIQYTSDDVLKILEHARPDRVVSGVYYSMIGPNGSKAPVAGRWGYNDIFKCESILPITSEDLEDVTDDGLVKVDGAGAGFLCFHRDLVNNMLEAYGFPSPWFITQCIDGEKLGRGQQWYGEDYWFCLRAKSLGVDTFLVPEVQLAHYKTVGLTKDS